MRYLPLTDEDRKAMLAAIGVSSVDEFYTDVPEAARLTGTIHDLPDHQGELAVERHMAALAAENRAASEGPFFIGCGAYKHHVPASVDHIIQRSEFLTTYTPYQPEIAQGTLQTAQPAGKKSSSPAASTRIMPTRRAHFAKPKALPWSSFLLRLMASWSLPKT